MVHSGRRDSVLLECRECGRGGSHRPHREELHIPAEWLGLCSTENESCRDVLSII